MKAAASQYRAQVAALVRTPARLLGLAAGSSGTTLVLAAGFATAATLPPAGLPVSDFGVLMIGYMIAAAAGNALPTPGGIGAADAAFTGVLVVQHVPAAHAITTVLAFRLGTFWLPALAGAVIARTLRRRGAL